MVHEVKANTKGVERPQWKNRNYEKEPHENFENEKYLKFLKNSL